MREARVGLVVVAAIGALFALMALAGGGPGFLAPRRAVEVVFRDGQGIRVGSPVRIAGIDSGRVQAIDLAEVDGTLRARLRLSLPAELARRLKQDAKITVQSGLTGQAIVNILSSGTSEVALVPGQVVQGVETSMFDPIMEQVGLGAVERGHLGHTIGEVRETVDAIGPRLRLALGALQETMANLRDASTSIKPAIAAASTKIEDVSKRIDPAKVQRTVDGVASMVTHADGFLVETRPGLDATLANVRALSAAVTEMTLKTRPKVDTLLDGLNGTRAQADRALANATVLTGQGAEILTTSRANIERTVANLRDTSDNANQFISKIKANPLLISPLYKPRPEDIRAQQLFEESATIMGGLKELNDVMTKMAALRARKDLNKSEIDAYSGLYNRAKSISDQMSMLTQQLAAGLNATNPRR